MTSMAPTGSVRPLGRVLVVDDEFHVGAMLWDVLTRLGYVVEHAEGGAEALELVATFQPDVVLLDLKMPVMSGREVLEHLRRDHPQLPVIILSGHQDAGLLDRTPGIGALDYLQKPVDVAVLARAVAGAVRRAAGGHDCGCPICGRALGMIRSIVAPSGEQPEAFLVRLDTEATAILREAGEEIG
jgi:CheY-like chemotaxis protein